MSHDERRIIIRSEPDLVSAILQARKCATAHSFSVVDVSRLATAVSELGRNIFKYAGTGQIVIRVLERGRQVGIEVTVSDDGPGIADVDAALQDHVSTGGTLGLGLPGVRRMMDDFAIDSKPGEGTRITIRKWR